MGWAARPSGLVPLHVTSAGGDAAADAAAADAAADVT